ncbi:MAG: hypothetical protein KDA97_14860 [Acidimicrobiales bacterium]|nr:hypothetical protein [Acidimicrobiales bacterium]
MLVVSTAAGVAYFFLAVPDDPREPETAADIARWCRDVAAGIGPDHPFADVASLVEAMEAGALRAPTSDPPEGPPEAVERWREEHAPYLTSSYLRQLTTLDAPRELTLPWAVLQLAIENAHDGRPGYDAGDLEGVVESLDAFLARRC